MIGGVELFDLSFGIVFDHDLQRTQHRHPAQRLFIEHLAHREIKHADVSDAVRLGDADASDEIAYRFGGYAAPAQARYRWHAGIVPAAHMAVAYKLSQHALRQHCVSQVEPREFILMRIRGCVQDGDEKGEQWALSFDFVVTKRQGADHY